MMKITGKVENELDSTLVATTPIAKTVASQNAEQQQVS